MAAATTKQVLFARSLFREIRDDLNGDPEMLDGLGVAGKRCTENRQEFSQFIDGLIAIRDNLRSQAPAPKPEAPTHDVPEGRYAITDNMDGETNPRFVQVDRPTEGKWAGYVFVKRLVGAPGDFAKYPVKNRSEREALLGQIAIDPQAAAIAFGRLVGVCGVCGSPLTNEESREYGIGPVCRSKTGW